MVTAQSLIDDSENIERYPVCQAACPILTDTRRYAELIYLGRYEDAFDLIHETNPFISVCGMICHHPCEQECRRQNVDDPIALRHLKRYICEATEEHRKSLRREYPATRSERIAVIGAGPAGLTAALDLRKAGYETVVFDEKENAGGVLGNIIPKYRLSDKMIGSDIDDIASAGVDIRNEVTVGEDLELDELFEDFDAVIIAVGLSRSRSLPLEGVDARGVFLALPFLSEVRKGERPPIGDNVVVIGGGNVAVDVARSAKRLGAEKVTMVCLESDEEMPAWEWEIEETVEEDIDIINSKGPRRILTEDGKVVGLETKDVERVFDENGRFNPSYYEDRISSVECDTIIISIGQASDLGFLKDTGVELNERKQLDFDRVTYMTTRRGVFAAGEVVTGPGAAIEAVASGHNVARSVNQYLLTGEPAKIVLPEVRTIGELPEEVGGKVREESRIPIRAVDPEIRSTNFDLFEMCYSEREALWEARRCLSCAAGAMVDEAACAACLTCYRVCPFDVPEVTDVAVMNSDLCQSCGVCAAYCPANAITIKRFSGNMIKRMTKRVAERLKEERDEAPVIAYVCLYNMPERPDALGDAFVPVHCFAHLDVTDLMYAFETDAKGVALVSFEAPGECCRYPSLGPGIEKRMVRTNELLNEAGLAGERVVRYNAGQDEDIGSILDVVGEKIRENVGEDGKGS